ncbi:hypothetical protein GCM10023189_49460 [Nibrella saemangeumensis]|uniref:SnoaL-like domain-containing protein n=1 Tax=Nibrella saemangeumensis TaxID=1084526 RepID=A0ABP8NJM4_9BACT
MKAIVSFLSVLLLYNTTAFGQDLPSASLSANPTLTALPSVTRTYPHASLNSQPAKDAISMVSDFLTNLVKGNYEAARQPLAEGFRVYHPGFEQYLETDNLIGQWNRTKDLFTNQQITIETSKVTTIDKGNRQGQWVFMKVIWSAQDNRQGGKVIQMPYYELAHIVNDKIQRTYVSYGNDQLFYDLGFPIYATQREVSQKR